jgi:hypothetical protein
VEDPELTAVLLFNLVLGRSPRLAVYGIATDPGVQERHGQAAVELFLNGVKSVELMNRPLRGCAGWSAIGGKRC